MVYDIDAAALLLADNVNGFEERTLKRIGRRIKETGRLSAADEKALKNMLNIGMDIDKIYADLAAVTETTIQETRDILEDAMAAEIARCEALYTAAGREFIPFTANKFAQELVRSYAEQTAGNMLNLSRTISTGFTDKNGKFTPIDKALYNVMDRAVMAVRAGTMDFNSAMRDTIKELGGSGVVVNYGSGVTRQLDSMVRQNLLYGTTKSTQQYLTNLGTELGADGFEVDYHPYPRPSHEFMGGVMFSLRGKVTIKGITYPDGTEALKCLGDYGCKHTRKPVFLGISQPSINPDELRRMKRADKTPIEYDGVTKTGYEWKQKQRALERATRQQKRIAVMSEAADNAPLNREARDKIKAYTAKYNDLCKKTGLQPTKERMSVSGYRDERFIKRKKAVDILADGGIIKTKNGIQINNLSSHAIERASERGITNDDIKNALQSPLKIRDPVLDNWGRTSQRFIGENATININPDTGAIITMWKTGRKTRKKYKEEEK